MKVQYLSLVKALVGAVLGAGSLACASAPVPSGTPGMVYDTEGRPLAGVRVSWEGQPLAASDLNGRFVLGTPPKGTPVPAHRILKFEKDGYEAGSLDLDQSSALAEGTALYLKLPSREALLKDAWAALDQGSWAEARTLASRARPLGPDDGFWALTLAAVDFLDPQAPAGAWKEAARGLVEGRYGPVEPGWRLWWADRLEGLPLTTTPRAPGRRGQTRGRAGRQRPSGPPGA